MSDSLKLAQTQYEDIATRLSAGAASRIDTLQAHQEVLARQRGLAEARAALGAALQDLTAITGAGRDLDTSFPWYEGGFAHLPAAVLPPSVVVSFDPLDKVVRQLETAALREPDSGHPAVRSLDLQSQAADRAANVFLSSRLPRIQVSARLSRDYPNGPILEEINQKTAGVVATMPLFEGGRVSRSEWELRETSDALARRRDQAMIDLKRDWRKASQKLEALRLQDELNRQSVSETKELAGLIYESYKSGTVRFIEVQAGNLKALEAQVEEARTKAEILGQLAVMHSLSKED